MLLVNIFQLAVVQAQTQLGGQLVVAAGEGERVAVAADTVGAHLGVVGGGVGLDPIDLAALQSQLVDLLHVQQGAAKRGRQQARVVGRNDRAAKRQGADAQGAVGSLELGGDIELGVFALRTTGAVCRQQAAARGALAGVELETEHTQRIDADADRAFGVAGLHAQQEALRPFFGLVTGAFLAEIAIEVEVAQIEAAFAVVDEVGTGHAGHTADGEQGCHAVDLVHEKSLL
ncbi:hypothetical protein D9M68_631450 [compost metagenome]